jgi:hypothetical protein
MFRTHKSEGYAWPPLGYSVPLPSPRFASSSFVYLNAFIGLFELLLRIANRKAGSRSVQIYVSSGCELLENHSLLQE